MAGVRGHAPQLAHAVPNVLAVREMYARPGICMPFFRTGRSDGESRGDSACGWRKRVTACDDLVSLSMNEVENHMNLKQASTRFWMGELPAEKLRVLDWGQEVTTDPMDGRRNEPRGRLIGRSADIQYSNLKLNPLLLQLRLHDCGDYLLPRNPTGWTSTRQNRLLFPQNLCMSDHNTVTRTPQKRCGATWPSEMIRMAKLPACDLEQRTTMKSLEGTEALRYPLYLLANSL